MVSSIVALVGAYIVGSMPTGYLIARWRGIADLRQHGSGTIGATNVARVLGKKFFVFIFLLDAGKAAGYMLLLRYMHVPESIVLLAAFCLVLGNIFSCFLRGNGGKGISTAIGVFMVVQPLIIPCVLVPFMIVLAVTHTVGMASVVGLCALPICAYGLGNGAIAGLAFAISFISLYAHRAHILRLTLK